MSADQQKNSIYAQTNNTLFKYYPIVAITYY